MTAIDNKLHSPSHIAGEDAPHEVLYENGLSESEAAKRLATDGPNELPSSRPRSTWTIAWEVTREPMFLLLLGAGAIYLILGDVEEALLLLGFVFVVIGITLYQERKTERALEALRDLSSPRALVVRNGEHRRIPGREVVRDDILILREGDRVPADAVLLSSTNLPMVESSAHCKLLILFPLLVCSFGR